MLNPPFRSPTAKVGGLVHLARMLDKIRLHQAGELPEEYQPNFGLSVGLDGFLCGFLNVEFDALCERVRQGGTDEEIAEWCFVRGLRPNKAQGRVWNEFARKLGWHDHATKFLEKVKAEEGLQDRTDLVTTFAAIDFREGPKRGFYNRLINEQVFECRMTNDEDKRPNGLAAGCFRHSLFNDCIRHSRHPPPQPQRAQP